jgi:hypothetical protein
MYKRLILIYNNRFTSRDYFRFGIDLLKDNGLMPLVWDVSRVLHSEFDTPERFYHDEMACPEVRSFRQRNDMYDAMRELNETDFVISFVKFDTHKVGFFRNLSHSKACYSLIANNSLPQPQLSMSGRINKYRSIQRFPEFLDRILYRIPFQAFGVRGAACLFLGGACSETGVKPCGSQTESVWGHSFDYDIYLQNKKKGMGESDVAVFLDDYSMNRETRNGER